MGLSLCKGEANPLRCLTGLQLKVNQYKKGKPAFHAMNTGCACVFSTGGTFMCKTPAEQCDGLHETRIRQHLRHCGAIAHRCMHTLTQQDSVQGIRNESVAYCPVRSQLSLMSKSSIFFVFSFFPFCFLCLF